MSPDASWFLRPASAGSPSGVAVAATASGAAVAVVVVVVEVIVDYPGVRWSGDVVAAASTVTAAFARKLHAAFACKGSNYGGDGGGGGGGGGGRRRAGGSQERFVLGGDRIPDRGAVSWCMRLPPRADIGDGVTGGSGGSGGSGGGGGSVGSIGKGSWSLARAVVYVVMGAFGKVFPTQNFSMGTSFTSRCDHTTLHGNSFLPTPT